MSQFDPGSGPSGSGQGAATTGRPSLSEPVAALRWALRSGVVAGVAASAGVLAGLRALQRGDRSTAFSRLLVGGLLATVAAAQRRSAEGVPRVTETDVAGTGPDVEGAATGLDDRDRATGAAASDAARTTVDIEEAAEESGADEEVATRTPDETAEADPQAETSDVSPDEDAGGDAGSGTEGEGVTDRDAMAAGEEPEGGDEATLDAARTPDEERTAEGEADAGETDAEADLAGEADEDAGADSGGGADFDESDAQRTAAGAQGPERETPFLEGDYERLGEAAFDGQSQKVPAPQEAFNEGLLSTGAEAFWGVREEGDLVVVSGVFDPLEDAEGVEYVASSEVDDDDRGVRIPDTILNHWDHVADAGDAVSSGTGIVFVVSEDLREQDQLAVVPAPWAEEVLGEE